MADGINWCFLQQESTFWRQGLYKKVGGLDTSFSLAGDWDLWRRFAQITPLVHLQYQIGAFRTRPGQLSSNLSAYWSEIEKKLSSIRRASRLRGLIPNNKTTFKIFFSDFDDSEKWFIASTEIQAQHIAKPQSPKKFTHILTITDESKKSAPLFDESFSPDKYTFSRISHMRQLVEGYIASPYGKIDINYCDLKAYQDGLCAAFIDQILPRGSKILEIGGGNSRICNAFYKNYECWNIDKFKGNGNGPQTIPSVPYKLVIDYIGNFNKELPNEYFDCIFSISALEHIPEEEKIFKNIVDDIHRLLKPGGWSLHLFDVVKKHDSEEVWVNKFIPYLFNNIKTLNKELTIENSQYINDIYFLQENAYKDIWQPITKRDYSEFGSPFSLQILWKK